MRQVKLTKKELKELVGGELSLQLTVSQDVDNSNSVGGCECTYNNHSVISNSNSVSDCKCTCK